MRKRSKSATKLLLATIVLTVGMSVTAFALETISGGHWQKDGNGWKYQQANGAYLSDGYYNVEPESSEYYSSTFNFVNGYSTSTPVKAELLEEIRQMEEQRENAEREAKEKTLIQEAQDKEKINIPKV